MSKKLETIQILFQKRNARNKGPTSSNNYNDTLDEIAHDLSEFDSQWNLRLVPFMSTVPDGQTITDLNAFSTGLDGKTLLVNALSTSSSDTQFWNTTDNRPRSVWEQFTDVYNDISDLSSSLSGQIADLVFTAEDIAIIDIAGLIDAENVENALAEIVAKVDSLSGVGSGGDEQVAYFDSAGLVIGNTSFTFDGSTLSVTNLAVSNSLTAITFTATNVFSAEEQAGSPTEIAGHGIFFVKTSDEQAYFKSSSGVERLLSFDHGTGTTNELVYWSATTSTGSTAGITWDGTSLVIASNKNLLPKGAGTDSIRIGSSSAAGGENAIAFGSSSSSPADNSIAIGKSADSGGSSRSIAFGYHASGLSIDSMSLGSSSLASAIDSIAIGRLSVGSGLESLAVGKAASSTNTDSIAIGVLSSCTGVTGLAVGYSASTDSTDGVAVGRGTSASSDGSLAIGRFASVGASSDKAIAVGASAAVSMNSVSGIAIGSDASASANAAMAIGRNANAPNMSAIAIGDSSSVLGDTGIALGTGALVLSSQGIAIGPNVIASGISSVAIGSRDFTVFDPTRVQGEDSVGINAHVASDFSVGIGSNIASNSPRSVSVGYGSSAGVPVLGVLRDAPDSIAIGSLSLVNVGLASGIALGTGAQVQHSRSIALGANAITTASGQLMVGKSWSNSSSDPATHVATYHGYTLIFTAGETIAVGDLVTTVIWDYPVTPANVRVIKTDTGIQMVGTFMVALEATTSGQDTVCMSNGIAFVKVEDGRPHTNGEIITASGIPGEGHTANGFDNLLSFPFGSVIGDYPSGTSIVLAKVGL